MAVEAVGAYGAYMAHCRETVLDGYACGCLMTGPSSHCPVGMALFDQVWELMPIEKALLKTSEE